MVMETASRRRRFAFFLICGVLLTGVVGYHLIEGWNLFDSLYMTVITVATVGYGETHPLTPAGRVFTIVLIMLGVGVLAYGLTAATAFLVEGTVSDLLRRRRMENEIKALRQHIVLCGIGETGRHVAGDFLRSRIPFVVIDMNREQIRNMEKIGQFLYIEGDATNDQVLLRAGIKQAKGLVSALPQDRDNVFVILTARELNPSLRIISKVDEVESCAKLMKVGADAVISANLIGGLRMASEMVRPTLVSFFDTMLQASNGTVGLEAVKIPNASKLVGRQLREAGIYEQTGLVVIALARGQNYEFNPSPQSRLNEGDDLVICCSAEQLKKLREFVSA